jgi:hypothetical protein
MPMFLHHRGAIILCILLYATTTHPHPHLGDMCAESGHDMAAIGISGRMGTIGIRAIVKAIYIYIQTKPKVDSSINMDIEYSKMSMDESVHYKQIILV